MAVDIENFITELDAGIFMQKLSRVLSDTAANIMDHEKKGEVTVKFSMVKTGSCQINIEHKLAYKHPTMRGEKAETDVTETTMVVSKQQGEAGVNLTLFPPDQHQMFDKKGRPSLFNEKQN